MMKITCFTSKILVQFIIILLLGFQEVVAQNSQCHMDDWNALKQLHISTNGNNWDNNTNWSMVTTASPQTFCDLEQLHGITLKANGRVESVVLKDNNLSGNIPNEIGNLTEVTTIELDLNQLTGTIPTEFSNLMALEILNLSNNQLIGSIPSSFAVLSTANDGKLMELVLQFNNLSSCYPTDLSALCAQSYYGGFISAGNNFDASWDDFCVNGAGNCSCSNNLNFLSTANHSANNIFQAGNQITSSATVNSNVNVVYKAGMRIRLNSGFNTKPNTASSRFSAHIESCN